MANQNQIVTGADAAFYYWTDLRVCVEKNALRGGKRWRKSLPEKG
ncbi:MAG: hypothetical protein ACYTBJ_23155 [Planctomycetota bacterium]